MTGEVRPPKFAIRSETDLEDYLEAYPSLTGKDLLMIGRQVRVAGGIIDLLAIDSNGVIYIVELKLRAAGPSVVGQVLSYRRSIKRLDREGIIRLAATGDPKTDLAGVFQRHFGLPLPKTLNESRVIMIIAESIRPQTADSILELLDGGNLFTTYRYIFQSDDVSLIPCCRTQQDVEEGAHLETKPFATASRVAAVPNRLPIHRIPIDDDVRRFWLTQAGHFTPFATFRFIYERYEDWVQAEGIDGVRPCQSGRFGLHLSAIVRESSEWTRIYVAPHDNMASYNATMVPPSPQTYRAFKHAAAYQFTPVVNRGTSGSSK